MVTDNLSHNTSNTSSFLGVYCDDTAVLKQAQQLSQQLSQQSFLPPEQPLLSKAPSLLDSGSFVLMVGVQGVGLQATGKKAPGSIPNFRS